MAGGTGRYQIVLRISAAVTAMDNVVDLQIGWGAAELAARLSRSIIFIRRAVASMLAGALPRLEVMRRSPSARVRGGTRIAASAAPARAGPASRRRPAGCGDRDPDWRRPRSRRRSTPGSRFTACVSATRISTPRTNSDTFDASISIAFKALALGGI
jgi:hypothetical protein